MRKIISFVLIYLSLTTVVFGAVTQTQVLELYIATFNRAADKAGLDYWMESEFSIDEIALCFFEQPETQTLYPLGNTDTDFVKAIYTNIFGRDGDEDGIKYWVNELSKSENPMIRSVMIEAMKNGALGDDAMLLKNKTTVAQKFVDEGLNDPTDAKDVLVDVTVDENSTIEAKEKINFLLGHITDIKTDKESYTLGEKLIIRYNRGSSLPKLDVNESSFKCESDDIPPSDDMELMKRSLIVPDYIQLKVSIKADGYLSEDEGESYIVLSHESDNLGKLEFDIPENIKVNTAFRVHLKNLDTNKTSISVATFSVVSDDENTDQADVDAVKASLTLSSTVTSDLSLETLKNGVSIIWSSSNTNVISDTGTITRGDSNQTVTLTAKLSKGDATGETTISIIVIEAEELKNQSPVANAGDDLSVTVNKSVEITGSGTDSDGTIVSYEWKKGDTVLGTDSILSYTPTTEGIETLTLTVTDNDQQASFISSYTLSI